MEAMLNSSPRPTPLPTVHPNIVLPPGVRARLTTDGCALGTPAYSAVLCQGPLAASAPGWPGDALSTCRMWV